MSKKVKKFSLGAVVFLCILAIVVGFASGFVGYALVTLSHDSDIYVSGDLSFHFLELGNANTGDCTLVKVGDTEVLIDAGSKTSSVPTIRKYLDNYVEDGVIEYVIVTHAHEDHYAGFATSETADSLFDIYEVTTIIDFAQITSGKADQDMYKDYQRELNEEIARGATHYTALECVKGENGATSTFELGSSVTMTILYQKYYETVASTENNHSVCTLFTQGDNNFLFTGDLEELGEKSLVEQNPSLPHCKLYKAGHHGSKTSSHNVLLSKISPEVVCVCCCAGNSEYTDNAENMFPTQDFINRISEYTDKVYVTTLGDIDDKKKFSSFNGNIVVKSNRDGIAVTCSNNDTILKDSDWFKKYRTMPDKWKKTA